MQSGTSPGLSEVALAQAIAAAVSAVPGIAELSHGRSAEVATYGAHEKVQGVTMRKVDGALEVEVHVCAQYAGSLDFNELASRVRLVTAQSLAASGAPRVTRIDVVFDDVRTE